MSSIPLSFRYNFDDDTYSLNAYDASVALLGISRSISISTHYLLNQTIITQAPSLTGAEINLTPPRRGSFIFDINVLLSPETALGTLSLGVASSIFYDYIKYIFKRTIGKDHTPITQEVTKITDKEGDVDTIVDTIESSVAAAHRPIIHKANNVVIFSGNNNLIRLDNESLQYVSSKVTSQSPQIFSGNISSFNVNSGRGRIYVSDSYRTIPFSATKNNFTADDKALLVWSLNEYVNGRPGRLDLEAFYVATPSGIIKKLMVTKVSTSII